MKFLSVIFYFLVPNVCWAMESSVRGEGYGTFPLEMFPYLLVFAMGAFIYGIYKLLIITFGKNTVHEYFLMGIVGLFVFSFIYSMVK